MASIPNELEPAILMKLSDGGLSHAEVADWANSRYAGANVTAKAVGDLARRVLSLSSFAAKQAARRGQEDTIRECMGALKEQVQRLRRLATKFCDEIENPRVKNDKGEPIPVPPGHYLQTVEQLRKVCDTTMHYAGVDSPEGQGSVGDLFADLIAEEPSSLLARQPGRFYDRCRRLPGLG